MTAPRNGNGDCFSKAVEVCRDLKGMGLPAQIVHGIPLGTGGEAEGRRYWHAWVELGDVVIDHSNDNHVTIRRDTYYTEGGIERTWHYNLEDAHDLMHELGHYGPWIMSGDWRLALDVFYPDQPTQALPS